MSKIAVETLDGGLLIGHIVDDLPKNLPFGLSEGVWLAREGKFTFLATCQIVSIRPATVFDKERDGLTDLR